jgi:hypothetical protein
MRNKKERVTLKNTNDVFGFQKAINFDKLNDPKITDELSRIFKLDNETPQSSYKDRNALWGVRC